MFRGQTSIDASKRKKWDEAMNYFNTFLADQDYAAGNHLTIADLSLIASASTMEVHLRASMILCLPQSQLLPA